MEMNETIAKILLIEENSREIVEEAEEKKRNIDKIIKNEKEILHESMLRDEKGKLKLEKETIINTAKSKAVAYINNSQLRISEMDKMDKANRALWVQELYKKVLSD